MNLQIAFDAAGGLALFLLAMLMMTEGLKVFAGTGLRKLLAQWTSTPVRGLLAGVLVTGIVQSSSAVTVATIGFVNAGVLTLRQALRVVFGANVGTTVTSWLVSLVGSGFKVDAAALPILAIGVALRLAAPGKRYRGLGEALAGFGLFFLGLTILKDAFAGLAEAYSSSLETDAGGNRIAFLLLGFVAAVLTQSSSAAIAIVLTAATGGLIGIESAAAAVIGAGLGTTSTAAVAVIKATPSARRLALGHIAFNVIAGAIALALLPGLLWLVALMGEWLRFEGSPAAVIALFHTTYKLLGVLIMLPLAGRLADWLERLFRSAEEDLARPQHLDATVAATPALAVDALRSELLRLRGIVSRIIGSALSDAVAAPHQVKRQSTAARALEQAITEFVTSVRGENMSEDVAAVLTQGLRTARYLGETARLARKAERLRQEAARLAAGEPREAVHDVLDAARDCLTLVTRVDAEPGIREAGDDAERAAGLARFQQAYEQAKAALLRAAVAQQLSAEDTDALLDTMSATRRLIEQLVKSDRLLRAPGRAAAIEAEPDAAAATGEDPQATAKQ